MDEEEYDYEILKEVGKVSYEVLQHSKTLVKPGAKLLEVAEKLEGMITEKGYEMSFPVNISINQAAAHYTPDIDDKSVFGDGDLVKIDLGARKEHYLTDCAMTIDLSGKHQKLIDAAEKALESAISMVKAGRKVKDIGKEIEKIATQHGVNPIRNLGGHGIDAHELHADVFIPNFDNGDNTELLEGQVIAIEPFMTTGKGYVTDGDVLQIYQKVGESGVRSQDTRDVSNFISENYITYPFATRWLLRGMKKPSEFGIRRSLSELSSLGMLEQFPVLIEKSAGMVAQAEKELIVEKDSCTIVTK
jgi:methionyl aminopeptidase